MNEKYVPDFFSQKILTKINGNALIKQIWNIKDWNEWK